MSLILRQNAVDVQIEITVVEDTTAVNISSASTKQYIIQKPSGTIVTKEADFVNSGTDGKLKYITIAGDLDELGRYLVQVNLVVPGVYTGLTETTAFSVERNLQ